jgi:regulator of PEP synthase PpsR (kinase-PPPase family)
MLYAGNQIVTSKLATATGKRRATARNTEPANTRLPTILLVSDGTGSMCSHVVDAALRQFEKPEVRVIRRANIRSPQEAVAAVEQAIHCQAVIFYTLVSEGIREALHNAAKKHLVPAVDLLGHVLSTLTSVLKTSPRCDPQLLYELEEQHIDRMDAVDFTLAHDDGLRTRDLPQADVVLVGASRVSKSATCFVLACRGIRAANVPLVPDTGPPVELLSLDPQKVIGLTSSVYRLQTVRQSRIESMRMGAVDAYVDPREIAKELRYATALMDKYGWRCVDVSFKAVEEVAKEVLRLIGTE